MKLSIMFSTPMNDDCNVFGIYIEELSEDQFFHEIAQKT